MHEVRNDLQRLDEPNRRFIIRQWRWLLFKQTIRDLPAPVKHLGFTAAAAILILNALPHPHELPDAMLPVVTAAAFAIGLAGAFLLPRRHRTARLKGGL